MRKRAALGALAVLFATAPALGLAADIPAPRKAELQRLLVHDCGSCHGMTLKGGLGAPLLPEALAAKDRDALADVILDGVPGTPMPPWRPLLSRDEALLLVDMLKKGQTP
ncbi:MAG TPA: cytochrome c [Azospirillaceae bacterium]|nr:cytochrome c [Azospirillaceae bacterium]